MSAFYSAVDDASDVGQPGMHLVVGKVTPKSYEVCASIVQRQTRFHIDAQELVVLDEASTETFHPNVLNHVTYISFAKLPAAKPAAKLPLAAAAPAKARKPLKGEQYWDYFEEDDYAYAGLMGRGLGYDEPTMSFEEFVFEFQNGTKVEVLKRYLADDPELNDQVMDFLYTFIDLFEVR